MSIGRDNASYSQRRWGEDRAPPPVPRRAAIAQLMQGSQQKRGWSTGHKSRKKVLATQMVPGAHVAQSAAQLQAFSLRHALPDPFRAEKQVQRLPLGPQ